MCVKLPESASCRSREKQRDIITVWEVHAIHPMKYNNLKSGLAALGMLFHKVKRRLEVLREWTIPQHTAYVPVVKQPA